VHPEGEGARLAMVRAMADAGVTPDDVQYINAHGTSTPTNDPGETLAIKRALVEARARQVPVSSNKSMIGHTIGAAGAVEAILTWKGIAEGIVLPTINYETPDPKCDLDYVPNVARRMPHAVALSNSFGFGGQNACLCVGAAPTGA
jgi:3-oxoacyl-[acyl-carrier-protein] synthase II